MEYNQKMLELGSKRSIIREIFEYSKVRAREIGEENVFDFSLGNPSLPAPKCVNETIAKMLSEEDPTLLHGYTSAQGDPDVRRAIAESIRRRFGVNLSPDLIYMTCGAAASLSICLKALIREDANDECIVFAPFFTEYKVFIENAGAKMIVCPPMPSTLDIDVEALAERITPRTRAVILNSPNNPSGVVYPKETIERVCELLRKRSAECGHSITVIADEPYRELVYSDVSVPYLMSCYDDTLVCYSYSKSLSLPGERIGYIAVSPTMKSSKSIYLAICGAGRSLGYVCAPSLFQRVIARCIDARVNVDAYRENRDIIYNGLTDLGYECIKPDGAFYLMIKTFSDDAFTFYEKAKAKELLVVPCDDFGISGYVRLAYCVSKDKLLRSLPAFKALAEEYSIKK